MIWDRVHETRKARQRYAERVAAWTGDRVDCRMAGDWAYHWGDVVVHNGGEQLVYDAVVTVPVPGTSEPEEGELPIVSFAVGLTAPGRTVISEFGCRGQEPRQYAVPLEADFTDARGVRWKRDAKGRLRSGALWRDRRGPLRRR